MRNHVQSSVVLFLDCRSPESLVHFDGLGSDCLEERSSISKGPISK